MDKTVPQAGAAVNLGRQDRKDQITQMQPDSQLHPEHHADREHRPVHEYTIVVNARKKEVHTDEMTFEHVVDLAFDSKPPVGPGIVITVTYRHAAGDKHGTLLPGQMVKIKNGTVFNVTATDKS